ncbi:sensor domain-containing protein [Pengzhenrongella sicca]|uniref:Diguanylate cyclase n=1 Tax=Pengzhenrongella sicca TaxID=2819238 RepID=A0A8A4ZHJ4_9MICO|nr:diguanylate cyclase [Pengzhenrongella sicca]QTE29987.1 diguanylate cyclase [Pengzhenrongella sicca]
MAALDDALGKLAEAHVELAEAHIELDRRQGFTEALLETIDVGIVSCDADGLFVLSNRAERAMFGLTTGLAGLRPEHLPGLFEVRDAAGDLLAVEEYPLLRALRGEDVAQVEVLVGPPAGPLREVVVRGSRILGPDGELLGAVAALADVSAERVALRALAQERHNLDEAQRLGQLGGFEHDLTEGTWTFSDQLCALWGLAPGPLGAEAFGAFIVAEDLDSTARAWRASTGVGGKHDFEFRIRRADDGAERVLRARIEVQLDADGRPTQIRGTHLDITELVVAQRATEQAHAFSAAILAASPDDTIVTDLATGAVVYVSPGRHLLGRTSAELVELGARIGTEIVHPDDLPRLQALRLEAADCPDGGSLRLRMRGLHRDGEWRWLDYRATPFRRDGAGRVLEVLAVIRDVTDLVHAEEQLTHAALHDSLTGLPNRALLVDRLEAALDRSRRDEREIAVLFCDLDGFKDVNDTGGHSAGDAVLRETARRLRDAVRSVDLVARVGGDEFVVVVEPWNRDDTSEPAVPARTFAVALADRIVRALREPLTVRGLDHVVTASIGITYVSVAAGSVAVTVDEVLHHADAAMYRAKVGGKDRYEIVELGSR